MHNPLEITNTQTGLAAQPYARYPVEHCTPQFVKFCITPYSTSYTEVSWLVRSNQRKIPCLVNIMKEWIKW